MSEPRLKKPVSPLMMARTALDAALDKKAENPLLLEVGQLTGYADYFILLSGRSTRQVSAIAEAVRRALKKAGIKPLGLDGLREGRWALLDYGDIIIHVFHEPVRAFYDLEGHWGDARRLEADPEARTLNHEE